jgi:hypothetical protein
LQPSRYEAQADSSLSSWRKNKAASGYRVQSLTRYQLIA